MTSSRPGRTSSDRLAGTPRVSIGVPVYNGERYLEETLEALLSQTLTDFEVVISDNASTDRTSDIGRAFAARDERIRYFRNSTNVGSAMNFNRIVELSRAEYFKLANADDLCAPELVAKCVSVLDDHPEVVLAYARTMLIDEHGASCGLYDDRLDIRSPSAPQRFREAMDRVQLVNILQGVMRSSALRYTGLLGPYLSSDLVLVAELALHGQFWEVPEPLFYRRMHPDALSGLASVEGRWEYVAPASGRKLRFYHWRLLGEHFAAAWRAPLATADRLSAFATLLRRARWSRNVLLSELVRVPLRSLRGEVTGWRE